MRTIYALSALCAVIVIMSMCTVTSNANQSVFNDQDYRKSGEKLPDDIKKQLPNAVKEPAGFIVDFLKKDQNEIHNAFLAIYRGLSERYETEDESRKKQFAKNLKRTQEQWKELTNEQLKSELNRDDFLKASWLQYMLYAYRNHVNEMRATSVPDALKFGISQTSI